MFILDEKIRVLRVSETNNPGFYDLLKTETLWESQSETLFHIDLKVLVFKLGEKLADNKGHSTKQYFDVQI